MRVRTEFRVCESGIALSAQASRSDVLLTKGKLVAFPLTLLPHGVMATREILALDSLGSNPSGATLYQKFAGIVQW